jgi:hypothetical protein
MKWLVVVAALALCTAASATAATPAGISGPQQATVLQASCSAVPAAYRANSTKTGLWIGTCLVCKKLGPRQMARSAHLAHSDAGFVSRWYAQKYIRSAAFQRIAVQFGGVAVARPIVAAGCLTGFRARGRP